MGDYNGFDREPSMDEISLVSGADSDNKEHIELGDDISLVSGTESGTESGSEAHSESAEELYLLGKGMYEQGNYAKAKEYLEKAFELGMVEACHELGRLYEQEEDYTKAREWYEAGVRRGDKLSMCALGELYFDGRGVKQSYAEAFRYYSMAEGAQTTQRLFNMAWMYQNGKGTKKDYAKALQYYERMAELAQDGDMTDDLYKETALAMLGIMYAKGNGCKADFRKAVSCFGTAAELGDDVSAWCLGCCYEYGGRGIKKNMYLAHYWYKKAAEMGNAAAAKKLKKRKWDKFKPN